MIWPFGLAICTYFSPEEQLLLTPEVNKGTEFLTDMINRGWSNIFQMLDMSRADKGIIESKRLGFFTSNVARRDLVNHLNAFIIGKLIEIHSMLLVGELKDLVIKETISANLGQVNKKILGARNKSDNRFMAFGIGLYALHRDEILGFTKKSWEERIRNENSIIVLKKFRQDALAVDDASQSITRMLIESEEEFEILEDEISQMLAGLEEEEEFF